MGLFHRATIVPSKAELLQSWVPTQPWAPPGADADLDVVGAFRFDDPEGHVGIETHLVRAGGTLLQVPFTYRNDAVPGAEASLVGTTEHSALGTRWVYDGLGDDRYLMMLAAVAMTGQGEALGLVDVDGRWFIAPANVRITGGGWSLERVPVDGFRVAGEEGTTTILRSDGLELRFHRAPMAGERPPLGLSATWDGQPDEVVLAQVVPVASTD